MNPTDVITPYAIESIAKRKVVINKPTHKWDLSQDNFTAIYNNPLEKVEKGTVLTVIGILHHNIGYTYYLEDEDVPRGFNVKDCDTYVSPPLTAAPAPYRHLPPMGALRIPTRTEKYYVIRSILGFPNYSKALSHKGATKTVRRDAYYVFKRTNGMINVTTEQGVPGLWINPADNTEYANISL